jgi:hypothetical protein
MIDMSIKSFHECLLLILIGFIGITAFWGPRKWLFVSVGLSFFLGLLLGILTYGFPAGFPAGGLYGFILAVFVGISGFVTRYFRERAHH